MARLPATPEDERHPGRDGNLHGDGREAAHLHQTGHRSERFLRLDHRARYGSLTPEGISYTEAEFNYAAEKGIPILAFIHRNPGDIPQKYAETDPELAKRLQAFRARASSGRMVEFWEHKHELASVVVTSLTMAIAIHDKAVGWVRADKIDNTQLLTELNEVRKQKEELESKLAKAVSHPHIDDLAGLYDNISLHGYYESNHRRHGWRCEVLWADVFAAIAPYLFDSRKEDAVRTLLEQSLPSWIEPTVRFPKLDSQVFQTIKIQLMAHNLVDVSPVAGMLPGGLY